MRTTPRSNGSKYHQSIAKDTSDEESEMLSLKKNSNSMKEDSISGSSDSETNIKFLRKGSNSTRSYEEKINQKNILNNKLIDKELLKTVSSFSAENVFNNISKRLKDHLKNNFANALVSDLAKTYKFDY